MFSSLPKQVLPPFYCPPRVPVTALGLSWDSCGLSVGSLYWEVLVPPLGVLREYWLLLSLSVLIEYACMCPCVLNMCTDASVLVHVYMFLCAIAFFL